jgi:hypothetical protein
VPLGEDELVQDLRVLAIRTEETEIHVDLYGGRRPVCASIRFTFVDPIERESSAARLEEWSARGTPVTLLAAGDTLKLFRERDAFERALLDPEG